MITVQIGDDGNGPAGGVQRDSTRWGGTRGRIMVEKVQINYLEFSFKIIPWLSFDHRQQHKSHCDAPRLYFMPMNTIEDFDLPPS